MIDLIHRVLDRVTMYRLTLYILLTIWSTTIILSALGILGYNPLNILLSGIILGLSCNLANWLLTRAFGAAFNLESASITSLILALIVGPSNLSQIGFLLFLGFIAMATKYVIVVKKHHLFNPAAIAVLITGLALNQGASWWVGSIYTLPIIIIGGICMVTKAYRWPQTLTFIGIYISGLILTQQFSPIALLYSPIWFFTFVMLSEPRTSPSLQNQQLLYGAIVAISLMGLPKIFPTFPHALEASLLLGNLVAFLIAPTANFTLTFKRKQQIAPQSWAFFFEPEFMPKFNPGQYLELTIPHPNVDQRGSRRFFTIASAPQDNEIMIAARIPQKASSFKQALMQLKESQKIQASGPYGDFILPSKSTPVAFIAGGIGITPFNSMLRNVNAAERQLDINLIYLNSGAKAAFYPEIGQANDNVQATLINTNNHDTSYQQLIENIPDYRNRTFYISGPPAMVDQFRSMLKKLGVKHIKTDYFPGYGR